MTATIEGMLPMITVEAGFVVFVGKDGSQSWASPEQAVEYAERIAQAASQAKFGVVPINREETT